MIRPRVFILGAAVRRPLQLPITLVSVTVPRGSDWRLDYILASYPRTVAAGAQTSPELSFRLFTTRGVAHDNRPILFGDVTSPSGFTRVRRSVPLGIPFHPGEVITIEVFGMAAGPVPATISITLHGQKGWEGR